MFKSEAKLFLSANNKVNSAKTLINECKRLIVGFDLEGYKNCERLKLNIDRCDINALVTKVEDTKEDLMELDKDFAEEYMTLLLEYLQTPLIDTSNMTDEEKMKYSIQTASIDMTDEEKMKYNIQMSGYARDYNYSLLYMLEKNEKSGMLTDEMKHQLQYQRDLVAQYDIQDKMVVLDPTTDEYINLYKQYADYDRKLINLNSSLTEEEKASYLEAYNTQYNQNLDILINARDVRLKREADEKELEELYKSKEDNNGFWHPFVESEIDEAILDKRIEMGIASEDEIAYKNMNGWERAWENTKTFAVSTFTGLYNINEGIDDGLIMLGSAVGICDKDWASEYISRDLSGELYQGIVLSNNMNSYSAYGTWHTAGEAFGGFVGKTAITFAAPWASSLLYGLDAMGQSAEASFNNGDSYWAAFGKSFVAGIGGAAEGYGLSKLNLGIRNFASSGALKTLGGTVLSNVKNFGATLTSPGGLKIVSGNLWNLVKSGVKHMPSALGKAGLATLKDVDALIETGCVIANNFIDGVTTGEWDWGKMLKEAGTVFAINYFMSFVTTMAYDINGNKVNGVTDRKKVSVETKEIEVRKVLQSKYPDVDLSSYTFEDLKKMYPSEIQNITIEQYRDIVYADKSGYYDAHGMPKTAAKYDWDAIHGTGAFDKLSLDKQTELIDMAKTNMPAKGTAQYDKLVRQYSDDVASKTISTLESYKVSGKIKAGYEVDDVLRMIQDDVDPSVYLTQEAIDDWRKQWRVDSTAPAGKVNTYTFQPEEKCALGFGTVGYGANGGFVGEGAFALTESKYNWIMDPKNGIFDADGVCINKTKLSEVLGGVQFGSGGIVVVKQTIPEQSLRMATGNLQGAFIGDWCPGGLTSGGAVEGLTPPARVTKTNSKIYGDSLVSQDVVTVNGINYKVKTEITMHGSSGSLKTNYNGKEIYDKLKN